MPYLVNGQMVPEELVRQEFERLSRDLRFQTIPDEVARAQHCAPPPKRGPPSVSS
jgi:hypothetical protein